MRRRWWCFLSGLVGWCCPLLAGTINYQPPGQQQQEELEELQMGLSADQSVSSSSFQTSAVGLAAVMCSEGTGALQLLQFRHSDRTNGDQSD